jgi:hypothetical protein
LEQSPSHVARRAQSQRRRAPGQPAFAVLAVVDSVCDCLVAVNGKDSTLATAFGRDRKGLLSIVIYAAGIALSFVDPRIGLTLYVLVACMWFIPDRRIESTLRD